MLLRLLAGLSLIGAIISAVAAILTGFELAYIALAVSGVFSFAVLIAASDVVDYLATIARNTEQKPLHAQPSNGQSMIDKLVAAKENDR